jgi:hypothetical protein
MREKYGSGVLKQMKKAHLKTWLAYGIETTG